MSELVERLRVLADGEPAYISLTITEAADRIETLERAAWRVIGTQDVGDLGDAMRELERIAGNP